jgi:hypothetical protein
MPFRIRISLLHKSSELNFIFKASDGADWNMEVPSV